jgi:hypothetical protein
MAIATDFGAETTTDADYANQRNFYKVELWTKDDQRVEQLLHAGNSLMQHAPCLMRRSSIGRAGATQSGSGAVW